MPDDPGMNNSGAKVLRVSDADVGSSCYTLVSCLTQLRTWSRVHPSHVAIPVMIEYKTPGTDMAYFGGAQPIYWNDSSLLESLDAEFRPVFSDDELITPDDVRRGNLTLQQSVLTYGWLDLASARGRFMFLMDDASTSIRGAIRNVSTGQFGRPNAEGCMVFLQSNPGQPDCAIRKMNTPTGACLGAIQDAVSRGYLQVARFNPVTAAEGCTGDLENMSSLLKKVY